MRYSILVAAGATAVAATQPMCRVKYVDTAAKAPAASSVPLPPANAADCENVHIFLAKGWNEPYPGRQGALAGAICSGVSSCGYEDIQFVNYNGTDFCAAVSEGAKNGLSQIKAYTAKCPSSKLVVSGYSQGAFVVSNMLGGSGGAFSGGCTPSANSPLDITGAGKQSKSFQVSPRVSHASHG